MWPRLVGWIQYRPSLTSGFTRAPSHRCTFGSSGARRPWIRDRYHTHARMHALHVPKQEPSGTSAAGISAYQETEKSSKFRPKKPLHEAWPFRQQHLMRHPTQLALSRCPLPRRVQGLPFAPVDLLQHHALHLCAAGGSGSSTDSTSRSILRWLSGACAQDTLVRATCIVVCGAVEDGSVFGNELSRLLGSKVGQE